jgi:hypothetical protein
MFGQICLETKPARIADDDGWSNKNTVQYIIARVRGTGALDLYGQSDA